MVSIENKNNVYDLRDWLLDKAIDKSGNDPLKNAFLVSLGILPESSFQCGEDTFPLYQKCAIAGLLPDHYSVSSDEIMRLLGQAAIIDGTPRPWVADIWGVWAIKLLVSALDNTSFTEQFQSWISGFLPDRISGGRLDKQELVLARFVNGDESMAHLSPMVALYLHYRKVLVIDRYETKQQYINQFLNEFKLLYEVDSPAIEQALYAYVFDRINEDASIVPPNNWGLQDLMRFLENISVGLKRWTWEDRGKTKGAEPRKWYVENEYHVQNLLYVMLAPIFNDISDEENLESVGHKNPRVDLYLPSAHTIIEVKYRKNNKKSFADLLGEIGEDISLYRSDPKYSDCHLICFLWDHTRATQEHAKFKEGVLKMQGIDGCVVVNSPSNMD